MKSEVRTGGVSILGRVDGSGITGPVRPGQLGIIWKIQECGSWHRKDWRKGIFSLRVLGNAENFQLLSLLH